jgi:glycosyltransferase involved in cell wall biosynthesis
LIRYLGEPDQGIEIIAPGVDSLRYQRVVDSETLAAVRDKYRLPDRFVFFVGNVKPHKNLSGLVRAFEKASLANWGLVVAGKNRGLKNQQRMAEEERIISLGEVAEEDLPALYSLAGMLVLPSLYEGFGLPPLEAMGCGCPTIVSAKASLPEVCGDASLYVDPEDAGDMARAIREVAENRDLQQSLTEKGFSRIESFHWRQTIFSYRELFEKVHRA